MARAHSILLPALLPVRSGGRRPASTTSSTSSSALFFVVAALCSIPYDKVARCTSLAPESFRQATWVPDTMWEEGLRRMELLSDLTRAPTVEPIARTDAFLSPGYPVPTTGTTFTVGQLDLVSGEKAAPGSSQRFDASAGSCSNDSPSSSNNPPASRFDCGSCGKQCGSFFVRMNHERQCARRAQPEPMDFTHCEEVDDDALAQAEIQADKTDDAIAQIRVIYI